MKKISILYLLLLFCYVVISNEMYCNINEINGKCIDDNIIDVMCVVLLLLILL